MLERKMVRVRMVKNYPTAHNHVALGEVIDANDVYIRINCRIFHFSDRNNGLVGESEASIRLIPWQRIEVIAELTNGADWRAAAEFDAAGNLVLKDVRRSLVARASAVKRRRDIPNSKLTVR